MVKINMKLYQTHFDRKNSKEFPYFVLVFYDIVNRYLEKVGVTIE